MIYTGIDIGSHSIKVAKISQTGRGYSIKNLEEFLLLNDPSQDQAIEILEVLKNLSQLSTHEKNQIILGLKTNEISFRLVSFPFKERYKILKTLLFELEEKTPLSPNDSVFDAQISHYTPVGTNVLTVGSPKETIKQHLDQALSGGITPSILSVESLAFSNLFLPWQKASIQKHENIDNEISVEIIINFGHTTSELICLYEGTLLEVRSIRWGGKDVIEKIAEKYSLQYVDAVKELTTKSALCLNPEKVSREEITMSEVLKQGFDSFAHKLNLTLIDLQTSQKLKFTSCTLCGGLSKIDNVGPFLTQKTGIACNPIKNLYHHPRVNTNKHGVFLTAIGLALEGLRKSQNPPINLLKGEFQTKRQDFALFIKQWKQPLLIATATYIIFFMWTVMRNNITTTLTDKSYDSLRSYGTQIAGLSRRRSNEREIRKFIRKVKRQAKNQETIVKLNDTKSVLDVLKEITSVAPTKNEVRLNVNHFQINNDVVNIKGNMKQNINIQRFKENLKPLAQGPIKSLPLEGIPQTETKEFHFQFKLANTSR